MCRCAVKTGTDFQNFDSEIFGNFFKICNLNSVFGTAAGELSGLTVMTPLVLIVSLLFSYQLLQQQRRLEPSRKGLRTPKEQARGLEPHQQLGVKTAVVISSLGTIRLETRRNNFSATTNGLEQQECTKLSVVLDFTGRVYYVRLEFLAGAEGLITALPEGAFKWALKTHLFLTVFMILAPCINIQTFYLLSYLAPQSLVSPSSCNLDPTENLWIHDWICLVILQWLQPSRGVGKSACSEPVPKRQSRQGCGRESIWRKKIPWGAWLGLLSLSSVWLLQACQCSYSERCE